MKRETIKKIIALTSVLTIGLGVTGCSSDGSSSETTTANSSNAGAANNSADNSGAVNDTSSGNADGTEVKTIRVGGGNNYNPACYLDENGEPAGYDYAVLQAIDELLPQYEFTYETFDFQNVLLALDSGKIDLASHQFEWNEDRGNNYLYGEEGYTKFDNYIWVPDSFDLTGVSTLEDLAGTVAYQQAGANTLYYFEKYNQEHPGKEIIIDLTVPGTSEEMVTYFATGKWNLFTVPKKDIELYNEAFGEVFTFVQAIDEPLNSSYTYFLFRKDDQEEKELQEAVDGALRQLKESGRLAEISIEYWGDDYTGSYDDEATSDRRLSGQ